MSEEVRTYLDIQDAILRRGKIEDTSENRKAIKEYINTLYQQICREEAYRWSGADGTLVLKARHNTGTITVTQNSDVVTGTGNSWVENDHRFSRMQISGSSYPFTVIRVQANNVLILDTPWTGATTADLSYSIYKEEYGMFPDFQDVRRLRIPGLSTRLQPRAVPPSKIDQLRDQLPFRSGTPLFYTVFGNAIYTAKTWATFNLGTDYWEDGLDDVPKNPALIIWPAMLTTDRVAKVRYTRTPYALVQDTDEPWIPYEDRAVLVWGVLSERFLVNRDAITAREWKSKYDDMKKKMASDIEITDEELILSVDASQYSRNINRQLDEDELDNV